MNDASGRIRLADTASGPGRSTATLLASLQSRLVALHLCSGADAIASLTAGFARLGREVSQTAEGARLRKALETSRAAANGRAIWKRMRLVEWTCGIYPTPVLDQLRNDLALLLADDVEEMLNALPIPSEMAGVEGMGETPDVDFLDVVLGLWAFSRELVRTVDAVASPMLPPSGAFTTGANKNKGVEGSILR
jgi:hypothetical protein